VSDSDRAGRVISHNARGRASAGSIVSSVRASCDTHNPRLLWRGASFPDQSFPVGNRRRQFSSWSSGDSCANSVCDCNSQAIGRASTERRWTRAILAARNTPLDQEPYAMLRDN